MGKNKRIFQQKKGITLIALVVTVIIILILGSITINMAFGENGLLKQSQGMQANRENQEQEDDENLNEIVSIFTNEINTITVFTITFMVGGAIYKTIQSNKIEFPISPTVAESQNFEGWYYDQETTNKAEEGTTLSQDITLYGKIENLEKHTITFYDRWNWTNKTHYVKKTLDTIETYKLKITDKRPEEKWLWTCGCESYNVRYVFSKYGFWSNQESQYMDLKEGDKLTSDIEAYAWFKLDTGDIQQVQKANFTYTHTGDGINSDGSIVGEVKEIHMEEKVFDGIFEGEKINSVQIIDQHGTTDCYNLIGGAAVYYYSGSYDVPSKLTIDNSGNIILTEEFTNDEWISTDSETRFHFIVDITTESGKKTRVLYDIYPEITNTIYCLAEGTEITLANRKKKKIEDIIYEDELLVWDFDNGCFATAKPLWIKNTQIAQEYNLVKFEDGTELKTVADHRIFNVDSQKFTYTMNEEDTPIGTKVFKEDGTITRIVERKVVKENVNYYNVITDYHMNLFANGLLTSLRLNNLYKIEGMKFVKDNRELTKREEFTDIPDKYFYGLRLAEQPKEINRGNDVKHTKTLVEYVKRLLAIEK